MCLVQANFVLLTTEHSKQLIINYNKNVFLKWANGARSSNVTATISSGKRVTSLQLTICVLLEVVNIPQFKTQTQTLSLS
jgi:hypothetical protein